MRALLMALMLILAACQREQPQETTTGAEIVNDAPAAEIAASQPPNESTAKPEETEPVELIPLNLSLPSDLDTRFNEGPMENYDRSTPDFFGTTVKKKKKTSISGSVIQDEARPLDINGVQGGQINIKTEFD